MSHTPTPWSYEHLNETSDRPTVMWVGDYRIVKEGRGYDVHEALVSALEKADEELAAAGYRETQWPRPQISEAIALARGETP